MLFNSGQIYRKDAQWTETNEKSIFRFNFLSYSRFCTQNSMKNWPILSTKIDHNSKNKKTQKSENWFFIRFSSLRIFSVWKIFGKDFPACSCMQLFQNPAIVVVGILQIACNSSIKTTTQLMPLAVSETPMAAATVCDHQSRKPSPPQICWTRHLIGSRQRVARVQPSERLA